MGGFLIERLGILTSLILLLGFHLLASSPQEKYAGFEAIQWVGLESCDPSSPIELFDDHYVSGTAAVPGVSGGCLSQPFNPQTQRLEIEFFGTLSSGSQIAIQLADSDEQRRVNIENYLPTFDEQDMSNWSVQWFKHRFSLPEEWVGQAVELSVKQTSPIHANSFFVLRDRISFYDQHNAVRSIQSMLHENHAFVFLAFAAAMVLAWSLFGNASLLAKMSHTGFTLFLLALILLVHYRTGLFYYFDEYTVIRRFLDNGWHGIFVRHNEHFKPLFFAAYYAQLLLFRDWYGGFLLVSAAVHCVNAHMLSAVIMRLCPPQKDAVLKSRVIMLLYALSALHAGSLQWAMAQPALFSQTAIYVSLFLSLSYQATGSRFALAGVGLATFCAPLLFASGFNVLLLLLVCLGFRHVYRLVVEQQRLTSHTLRRTVVLIGCHILALLLPLYFYLAGGESASSLQVVQSMAKDVVKYLFVGTQFGTVLRGLGLFPSVELNLAVPGVLFPSDVVANPAATLSLSGMAVSVGFLLASFIHKDRRSFILCWFLGQTLMLCSLLLPAIGRHGHGALQSLSLRYMTQTSFGLFALLAPWLYAAVDSLRTETRSTNVLKSLFAVYLAIQLISGAMFGYFVDRSAINVAFLDQNQEWLELVTEIGALPKSKKDVRWNRIRHGGPQMPGSLAAGETPHSIDRYYRWLQFGPE